MENDSGGNEDAFINDDKTTTREVDEKSVGKSSRSLSFREKMRRLPPHSLLLKDRLKDKTVPYMDLFRPGPPPSRRDEDTSRRMTKWK